MVSTLKPTTGHKDAMDCSTSAQYLKRWSPAGLSAFALLCDAILLLVHNGQLEIQTTTPAPAAAPTATATATAPAARHAPPRLAP